MSLIKFYIRKSAPSWLLFICLCPVVSIAQNTQTSGALQLSGKFELKPSSVKDHNSFALDFFKLDFQTKRYFEIVASAQVGPDRDATTGQYRLVLENLFLKHESLFFKTDVISIGLIPNLRAVELKSGWERYEDYGALGKSLLEHFKYSSGADLGIRYAIILQDEWNLALDLVNGEGRDQGEEGSGKDIALNFIYTSGLWKVGLESVFGRFEGVAESLTSKQRTGVWMNGQFAGTAHLALEYYLTLDPVDKINQKVADKVDLSSLGGTRVRGEGANLLLKQKMDWSDIAIFAKLDFWNPSKESSNRWVRSDLAGVFKKLDSGAHISLVHIQSVYGSEHGSTVRDTESWSLILNQQL